MKIALIQCPCWGTYDPPLAIAQLSACLKQGGHEVTSFDLNIKLYLSRTSNYKNMWAWEQNLFWHNKENVDKFFMDNKPLIERHIGEIVVKCPKMVGFSVNSASKLASIRVARLLKNINKEIITVFGGPLFFEREYIEQLLNEDCVDIIVPGEGEVSTIELANFIETKRDIANCQGIYYKANGRIVNTGLREPMANLDSVPFLDFTDLPFSNYDDARHIVFMASRGCIQKCVFCSSRAFWLGYRSMSGERIFREIEFHKRQQGKINPDLGHVDFLDLLFNGNMKSLIDFCDLMAKAKLDIKWTANMIVRPEMDFEVIKKMREAGCKHVIFGIESGSQRILSLMKKRYRIEDAENIIKWMHQLGIIVTGNFMFGFPGETEEDFQKTLDFIRRNADFLDRVYPSRTYCAIEEFSYLHSNLDEFGIKPNPPNHLLWESIDGVNTYPERLRRCKEFSKVASSLGIEVACGVQTTVELDELFNLSQYYELKENYRNALDCFLKYFELEPSNEMIKSKIQHYFKKAGEEETSFIFDKNLLSKLVKAVIKVKEGVKEKDSIESIGREKSYALLELLKKENFILNEEEFKHRKINLQSSPRIFSLQIDGPCNSNCTFCARGSNYELFDLAVYRGRFGDKIWPELSKAEQIIFTGKGEFLLIPEAERILDYFDENFPCTEKVFFTNGSALSPEVCEKISSYKSKYTINISLHASNSNLHRVLTRTNNFYKILGRLSYLFKLRAKTNNPTINFIFVATILNIEDLPNFIRLAVSLGADKVICYYNYIYTPTQKYLSCFFKQEFTNQILDEAKNITQQLNAKIDLPPKFGEDNHSTLGVCGEPWSRIMFNSQGYIIPCALQDKCNENLEGRNFFELWNGSYFTNLRQSVINGNQFCFSRCVRINPSAVNNFHSHVVHHDGKRENIDILWADNF